MNQAPLSDVCCMGRLRATDSPHLISVKFSYMARGAGAAAAESESVRWKERREEVSLCGCTLVVHIRLD